MYWYGHIEACGSGLLLHKLKLFHTERCAMRLISVEKDWKHVLIQKVVTLNTCCDIVCLAFQLPHITTGSFQSHRRQPTTGSLQSQSLVELNKPSVRWKSFPIHKWVWWHFQVGWASGLQFVILWDNISNQRYVRIILFRMTFLDFARKSSYIGQVKWTNC